MSKGAVAAVVVLAAAGGGYLYLHRSAVAPPAPPPPAAFPAQPLPSPGPQAPVDPDETFSSHHDRAAAKTTVAKAPMEPTVPLATLLGSLVPDATMHKKHISKASMSGRVQEEIRNVTVTAFLWASKKEDDNDFHCILGTTAGQDAQFLTAEVSGLPPGGADLDVLRKARAAFLAGLQGKEPGRKGYEKFDTPVRVTISGSLFFDVDHPAGAVGPSWAKPKTAWEIHPVTAIAFGK